MEEKIDFEDEETGFVVISLSIGFLISFVGDDEDSSAVAPVGDVSILAGTLED